jgi:hypothetical protein
MPRERGMFAGLKATATATATELVDSWKRWSW